MTSLFPERGFMVVSINSNKVKFMTYEEYIQSVEWQERVTMFKDEAGCCEKCGSTEQLTGHHLNYLNIGNEPREDIQILCWPCHQQEHK
jgi:5-methylcytosine-specific restriction endonuclease McrA